MEKWNALNDEVVAAHNVHSFKEKLDKCRYGDKRLSLACTLYSITRVGQNRGEKKKVLSSEATGGGEA
ncbi:hypothetical protein E2C01_048181 [Portunus trituberculatus]|uniref:Uncharacterized protein n=1 Tax=Portunus trituberculatus TaxID=210409 RepID=A0A5B7G305_PORTR|nr:hypothetical protein [Portunus trituberculatus]